MKINFFLCKLAVISSLLFYSSFNDNRSKEDLNSNPSINLQEFGIYALFSLPFLFFNTKLYYLISTINKSYSKDELNLLLEKYNISNKNLKATRRIINIIDDTDEDGIELASRNIVASSYAKDRFFIPTISHLNSNNLSDILKEFNMNLSQIKIDQIIKQIKSDLKNE